MNYWKKITKEEQNHIIEEALNTNIDYKNNICLGVPGTRLDGKVFYDEAPFLQEAPFLRSAVANPNHIGCHTLGESESFFQGTHNIERNVIQILAEDILQAPVDDYDGYIATGGTEANIQACWMYRNYFINEYKALLNEIVILTSTDTHYSCFKASNLLQIDIASIDVNDETRIIDNIHLQKVVEELVANGKKYFIVIANVGTTMFGSVDNPNIYVNALSNLNVFFKIHLDAAFGGFIYPIVSNDNSVTFANQYVSSVTLDAHKMLQAPYGTGVFISRKHLMQHVMTTEAKYISGMDITLSGSRSGANAIAVWMILQTYGPYGWLEKMNTLLYRTSATCRELDTLGIRYYRNEKLNIITMRSTDIPASIADEFKLVPDNHDHPEWYKIVVMDHVEMDLLQLFILRLKQELSIFN